MDLQPVCVVPTGDRCGEGVVWHESEKALYWTDIYRFLIHRFSPADGTVKSWFFDQPVTAIVLTDDDDTLAVLIGSGVIFWEPKTDTRHPYCFQLEGWPQARLNDGRADPTGALWVGSMRNNVNPDGSPGQAGGEDGVLYRIDPDGGTSIHRRNVGISNTLAWSPDRRHFYFADSLANVIWAYDYDPTTRTISNETPFLDGFSLGLPDGSTMDSEGYLWNCRFYGACIVRVAPDGSIDQVIEMPVRNITTCTFGGPGLKTLYVTTAAAEAFPGDRLAGGLFALETEVAGQPENRFQCATIRASNCG
jgi:sugar lactone lactonase YvrE